MLALGLLSITLLSTQALGETSSIVRGRDPWVFRCVFEDRTRMVLITPKPGFWIAFNPETCGVHKIWSGEVDFRGKVYDFSQENSRAKGDFHYAAPNEIWRLPNPTVAGEKPAWASSGVEGAKDGWQFTGPGSKISTPNVDLSAWRRVFVAFDETGRKGPFRVDITAGDKVDQWFQSATSVEGENSWQWNFKRIERPAANLGLTVTSETPKKLRNLRLYGDQPVWMNAAGKPLEVKWDGYELVKQTQGVKVRFSVALDEKRSVNVVWSPEATAKGWLEEWSIAGLPKGESIYLNRTHISKSVVGSTKLSFEQNGASKVSYEVGR